MFMSAAKAKPFTVPIGKGFKSGDRAQMLVFQTDENKKNENRETIA